MRAARSQPEGRAGAPASQSTRLRGRWLLAVRVGWITAAVFTFGIVAAGFAVGLDRPELIHPRSMQAAFAHTGIPVEVTVVVGYIVPMAAFAVTGLLIFWRRSNDPAAMAFALALVTAGGTELLVVGSALAGKHQPS